MPSLLPKPTKKDLLQGTVSEKVNAKKWKDSITAANKKIQKL